MTEHFDVVVVGARCAGSPIAATLARNGLRVAVLEQATFPRPTLSSHVIQADSLNFLNRLGVLPEIRATGATFMTRTDTRLNDLRFIAGLPQGPDDVGGAACIRRHVLDPILARAAAEAGADVRMGTKVTALIHSQGRVCGVETLHQGRRGQLLAPLVIGADGRASTVAQQVGARRYNLVENERWYYWSYFDGADLGPEPTFIFHRWGDRHIFAGPADHGLYIVGVSPEATEREGFRIDRERSLMEHVRSCEPVAEALANATRAEKIYGITRFTGYFREAAGPGWVLLGDSGHFKDPAAGRGIGDAFHQGDLLASAILACFHTGEGDPAAALDDAIARWGRWRDRMYHEYYWLAGDIGAQGPLPGVVSEVARQLHRRGEIDTFLNLYGHRISPSGVITPGRVARAAAALLTTPGADRPAVLRELGEVLAQDRRRRRRARRPVFEDTTTGAGAGTDRTMSEVGA